MRHLEMWWHSLILGHPQTVWSNDGTAGPRTECHCNSNRGDGKPVKVWYW